MTTIYHNPRCSKSRETLALLQKKGIEPKVILYLQDPPGVAALVKLVAQLGVPVTEWIRFKEDRAAELKLKPGDKRSTRQWCELVAANPVLLERPIVVHRSKARIGRPPEKVLEIL